MNIPLASIQMDTSIQCRASINMETVNDYADRMTEGDEFPPVVLFGTKDKCWIGDGWHRVMGAQQCEFLDIPADLRKGDRKDALKYALGANASHGQRRTNEDKRRCVELAIAEWPKLTHQQVADLCGVGKSFVHSLRSQFSTKENCPQPETRVGKDGKTYPTSKPRNKPEPEPEEEWPNEDYEDEPEPEPRRVLGPPCRGMLLAENAIWQLGQIEDNDAEREQAFDYVEDWIAQNKPTPEREAEVPLSDDPEAAYFCYPSVNYPGDWNTLSDSLKNELRDIINMMGADPRIVQYIYKWTAAHGGREVAHDY